MYQSEEMVYNLHPEAYEIFKQKGDQNSVKVRRILQLTKDFTSGDFKKLRILDLACAEGLYSIEAALKGAGVVAIDGRMERMQLGMAYAQKKALSIHFLQKDVTTISRAELGTFDIIYCLGILYHLEIDEVFQLIRQMHDMCTRAVIIDTQIVPAGSEQDEVEHNGVKYPGYLWREHSDDADQEQRNASLGASLAKTFSFILNKDGFLKILRENGFPTVLECWVPCEITEEKREGKRITLVAIKSEPVKISSYPWLNHLSEDAIAKKMLSLGAWKPYWGSNEPKQ